MTVPTTWAAVGVLSLPRLERRECLRAAIVTGEVPTHHEFHLCYRVGDHEAHRCWACTRTWLS